MKAVPTSRYLIFFAIVAVGLAADLVSKSWVFSWLGMPRDRPSWWLIDGVFGFTTSLNEGALFGIGQGKGLVFSVLSIVAALAVVYWLFVAGAAEDLWLTVALACVTAGILGNLYDRLGLPGLVWQEGFAHAPGQRVYAVRDWLHFKIEGVIDWPIFNVADGLLVVGAALLVWHAARTPSDASVAAAAGGPKAD